MSTRTSMPDDALAGAGKRLRTAREAAGLSRADVAERLKMPVRVVTSLEQDDWSTLGAPVYVRGQLRSYARLMGLLTEPVLQASGVPVVEPPALTPHSYTPRIRRLAEQVSRRLVYIVITIAIVLPVWVQMQRQADQADAAASVPLDAPQLHPPAQPATGTRSAPVTASMAPVAARAAPTGTGVADLRLRLQGDSWVEVTGADGSVLASEVMRSGAERRFRLAPGSRLVLGNASAAQVEYDGQPLNLAPYQRANVARFTVSSDGSVTPPASE